MQLLHLLDRGIIFVCFLHFNKLIMIMQQIATGEINVIYMLLIKMSQPVKLATRTDHKDYCPH